LIGASTASEGGDEKKFGAAYLIENVSYIIDILCHWH